MPTSDDRTFGPIGTRVLLDNDRVRVWELRLDPGDSSDLHHHALDYLMVQIEGDKVAARFEPDSEGTFAGAEYLEGPVSPGTAIFASAGGRETAINIGEQTFREIIVEVKETVTEGLLPVHHVSLSVNDHDAALAFYTDVLGFEVLPRPEMGIAGSWLRTGNGVQIHLIEDAEFVAPRGPHLAFETRDMAGEIERLRHAGVEVPDAFELNGGSQTFFVDPSGNQIELNCPPPG